MLLERILARLDKVEQSIQAGFDSFERLEQFQTDKKKEIEQSSIKEKVATASEPPSVLQGKNSYAILS